MYNLFRLFRSRAGRGRLGPTLNNWIHKTESGEWNMKDSRVTVNFDPMLKSGQPFR